MKQPFRVFLAMAILFSLAPFVNAQSAIDIPHSLSYQGMLLNAAHAPVTGIHQITVKLYDVSFGGTALHTESFSASVDHGVFNVIIGSQSALESHVMFDKPSWLGISVDGSEEMTPRTALTAVPYAIHAETANSLAQGAVLGQGATVIGKGGTP